MQKIEIGLFGLWCTFWYQECALLKVIYCQEDVCALLFLYKAGLMGYLASITRYPGIKNKKTFFGTFFKLCLPFVQCFIGSVILLEDIKIPKVYSSFLTEPPKCIFLPSVGISTTTSVGEPQASLLSLSASASPLRWVCFPHPTPFAPASPSWIVQGLREQIPRRVCFSVEFCIGSFGINFWGIGTSDFHGEDWDKWGNIAVIRHQLLPQEINFSCFNYHHCIIERRLTAFFFFFFSFLPSNKALAKKIAPKLKSQGDFCEAIAVRNKRRPATG